VEYGEPWAHCPVCGECALFSVTPIFRAGRYDNDIDYLSGKRYFETSYEVAIYCLEYKCIIMSILSTPVLIFCPPYACVVLVVIALIKKEFSFVLAMAPY
jgi:hypothetical protein